MALTEAAAIDPRPEPASAGCTRRSGPGQARSRGLENGPRFRRAPPDEALEAYARATRPGAVGRGAEVPLWLWILHVRLSWRGEAEALDQLVAEYRPYALALARRLHRNGESIEDLGQVALEALVTALHRFDPERRVPFPAFATPTITGALKHHYRDRGWALRVPRRVHEILGPASQAAEMLASTLGREPTVQEVARELDIEVQDLLDAQEAAHARRLASFDADEAGGGGPAQLDRAFRHAEERIALSQALVGLSPRERAVLDLYYGQGLSQSVIAERYGVSQMQISRWLAAIVARLRAELL